MSVSKAIIIGRLGADAERVSFKDERTIVNMRVAAESRTWKDKESGERKQKTNWHRVVISNKAIVDFAAGLKKGTRVYIEGLLEEREYEKDGAKVRVWEVIVTPFDGQLIATDKKEGSGERVPTPGEEDMADIPY